MEPRYMRNLPALTEQEGTLLRTGKVAVIGCGGLGGYLIEFLSRLGVGSIVAVDGDVFEESNLNRQLLSEVDLLGVSKAKAAADRVLRINPDVSVQAFPVFLDKTNAKALISGCDAVLDGLDSIPARHILADACTELGIPYVYGAIQGWVAQAAISMPGDGLIRRLYPEDTVISDKSALSFTPAMCAAMQVSLCTKLLTGRPFESGKLYYWDLLDPEFETIPML